MVTFGDKIYKTITTRKYTSG